MNIEPRPEWAQVKGIRAFREYVERDPNGAACLLHYLQYGGTVLVDENGHVWNSGRGSGYGCYGRIREE